MVRNSRQRTLPPIDPSDSATVYQSVIPEGVVPGRVFEVQLPNGVKFQVRCPEGRESGQSFYIRPFQVQIPEGVTSSSRIFTAMADGIPVSVRAPRDKRPGDVLLIHAPVFSRPAATRPPAQDRPQYVNNVPPSKHDSWNPTKWQEYLKSLAESTPTVPDHLAEKIASIQPEDIPNEFVCPITTEIIMDPVVAVDGHTYERAAIEEWFKTKSTSPKTNEVLPSKMLIPNRAIRNQILEYIEKYEAPSKATPASNQSAFVQTLQSYGI